jgi:hypothetical protein
MQRKLLHKTHKPDAQTGFPSKAARNNIYAGLLAGQARQTSTFSPQRVIGALDMPPYLFYSKEITVIQG